MNAGRKISYNTTHGIIFIPFIRARSPWRGRSPPAAARSVGAPRRPGLRSGRGPAGTLGPAAGRRRRRGDPPPAARRACASRPAPAAATSRPDACHRTRTPSESDSESFLERTSSTQSLWKLLPKYTTSLSKTSTRPPSHAQRTASFFCPGPSGPRRPGLWLASGPEPRRAAGAAVVGPTWCKKLKNEC